MKSSIIMMEILFVIIAGWRFDLIGGLDEKIT